MASGCEHGTNGRNLIVCIDNVASYNTFSDYRDGKSTSVSKLYKLILKGASRGQRAWYDRGFGTYPGPPTANRFQRVMQSVHRGTDLLLAWSVKGTVQRAYQWLSENYEDGDRIFLFGFSRGALQARILSAMIDTVGLIKRGNQEKIPLAYKLYLGKEHSQVLTKEEFKSRYSRNVKVHFVGAWDTAIRGLRSPLRTAFPGIRQGMSHVCYFRQALALDECRAAYMPEYAGEDSQAKESSDPKHPHTLEVWFAGKHFEIGGLNVPCIKKKVDPDTRHLTFFDRLKQGLMDPLKYFRQNSPATMDLDQPPFAWMVSEAVTLGLQTKEIPPQPFETSIGADIKIPRPAFWGWPLLECLPFERSREGSGTKVTRKPHLGSPRKIQAGQKVHFSAMMGNNWLQGYTPKARLPDPAQSWEELAKEMLNEGMKVDGKVQMEVNAYTKVAAIKDKDLKDVLKVKGGAQIVYNAVIEALAEGNKQVSMHKKAALSRTAMQVLSPEPERRNLKLRLQEELPHSLSDFIGLGSDVDEHRGQVAKFLRQFTQACTLRRHERATFKLPLQDDDADRASVSPDQAVCIRNIMATGGQFGNPQRGHVNSVLCGVISPDGKYIVSGSRDMTVRIWGVETKKELEVLYGHTGAVTTLAFTSDGKHIISGSYDGTIRVWGVDGEALAKAEGDKKAEAGKKAPVNEKTGFSSSVSLVAT